MKNMMQLFLTVAHNKFLKLRFNKLLKNKSVLYDVKNIIPNDQKTAGL